MIGRRPLLSRAGSVMPPVFLGGTHFAPGKGGIGVVARLTARVLTRMGLEAGLLSLLDDFDGEIAGARWRSVRGSRLGFVSQCHLAAFGCDRFLYDSVSTARGHPRLPGLRRPYALWMHGIEVWHSLHRDRARALHGASLVIANSTSTLDRFQRLHGPLAGAKVCLLGTEADTAPAHRPRTGGPPTVLILGQIDLGAFYKGHTELIACWPHVVAAVPDARLVIAGGGNGVDHVRRMAKASPVGDSIDVTGFVPDAALAELWRAARVFAMPSRGEGFGLVYAEAMRHGLPVVASVHDAGREVNVDGETGFNVDLDRPGELAARLSGLLTAPEMARRMGRNGHARWRALFRFSAFEARLRTLLEPFLAAGRRHDRHTIRGR